MALTLLLGGARSGKSALAVRLACRAGGPVTFLATCEPRDGEMAERIARHRAERPSGWRTVDAPRDLAGALAAAPPADCVVVDCLGVWVANLLEHGRGDDEIDALAAEAASLAAVREGTTIAVSNEVGMGVVPASPLGRRYRDTLGRANATWAARADEAALVIAGRRLALEGDDDR